MCINNSQLKSPTWRVRTHARQTFIYLAIADDRSPSPCGHLSAKQQTIIMTSMGGSLELASLERNCSKLPNELTMLYYTDKTQRRRSTP